jgi:hypothetical protein
MVMKKKGILLCVLIALCAATVVHAQDELHGSVGVTYDTKYVFRGFSLFEGRGGIHPFLDVDLYGTGFGINVIGHEPLSGGNVNCARYDYTLYYRNALLADDPYQTNYMLGWRYYNYPDNPTKGSATSPNADLQELHAIFSWPNIFPEGFVPSYILVKMWPSKSGSFSGTRSNEVPVPGFGGTASGWAHILMLDYAMPVQCPITDEDRTLNWHSELVYNDGVGCAGQNVDNDWTNAVFGVSTDVALQDNLILTPGIYYQITMDKSLLNDDPDETWGSLTIKYLF